VRQTHDGIRARPVVDEGEHHITGRHRSEHLEQPFRRRKLA
jgi:hypothetical protein